MIESNTIEQNDSYLQNDYSCGICHESTENELFLVTECSHAFCLTCVCENNKINKNKNECPICKKNTSINNFISIITKTNNDIESNNDIELNINTELQETSFNYCNDFLKFLCNGIRTILNEIQIINCLTFFLTCFFPIIPLLNIITMFIGIGVLTTYDNFSICQQIYMSLVIYFLFLVFVYDLANLLFFQSERSIIQTSGKKIIRNISLSYIIIFSFLLFFGFFVKDDLMDKKLKYFTLFVSVNFIKVLLLIIKIVCLPKMNNDDFLGCIII